MAENIIKYILHDNFNIVAPNQIKLGYNRARDFDPGCPTHLVGSPSREKYSGNKNNKTKCY